jgi:hypothetical protein
VFYGHGRRADHRARRRGEITGRHELPTRRSGNPGSGTGGIVMGGVFIAVPGIPPVLIALAGEGKPSA